MGRRIARVIDDGAPATRLAISALEDAAWTIVRDAGADIAFGPPSEALFAIELPVIALLPRKEPANASERGGSDLIERVWACVAVPDQLADLAVHAERAARFSEMHREALQARREVEQRVHGMIARELFAIVERLARVDSPIVLRGERGTGKELVARAIHQAGPRRQRPFIAIDCTVASEEELFGGPARDGLFVQARGGTVYLDDIAALSPALQARVLSLLVRGEVDGVASDVRVIAAVVDELPRAELIERMTALTVPPLRTRLDDIPALVDYFLARARQRTPHALLERFTPAALAALSRYAWPGNARELEQLVNRAAATSASAELDVAGLADLNPALVSASFTRMRTLRELEAEYIAWVIERCDGNKKRAAEVLGVNASTLHRRLKR